MIHPNQMKTNKIGMSKHAWIPMAKQLAKELIYFLAESYTSDLKDSEKNMNEKALEEFTNKMIKALSGIESFQYIECVLNEAEIVDYALYGAIQLEPKEVTDFEDYMELEKDKSENLQRTAKKKEKDYKSKIALGIKAQVKRGNTTFKAPR